MRHAFAEHGGNIGADGSVAYLFNTVGLMAYPPGTDEEELMQVALEAGAEDVVPHADRSVEVLADPLELESVCAMLTHRGFAPATKEVTQRAASSLELSGETAERMVRLLQALEGLDEVRDVYSNVERSDEVRRAFDPSAAAPFTAAVPYEFGARSVRGALGFGVIECRCRGGIRGARVPERCQRDPRWPRLTLRVRGAVRRASAGKLRSSACARAAP